MKRRLISLAVDILVAVLVFRAWGRMALAFDENGALSSVGWGSLKYFTVLSNLLAGFAAVFSAALGSRALIRGEGGLPRWTVRLKYVSAVAVALTFTVVMVFLGPTFGYAGMFVGASFWMHLVVPLTCVFQCDVLDRGLGAITRRDTLLAVLPMLIYGVGYVGNIMIHGVGRWPNTNDWYGFAAAGLGWTPLVFLAVALATWGLALLIRLPRKHQ